MPKSTLVSALARSFLAGELKTEQMTARAWNIRAIESAGGLADWLWLDHGELRLRALFEQIQWP
jgi:hypothetical protein